MLSSLLFEDVQAFAVRWKGRLLPEFSLATKRDEGSVVQWTGSPLPVGFRDPAHWIEVRLPLPPMIVHEMGAEEAGFVGDLGGRQLWNLITKTAGLEKTLSELAIRFCDPSTGMIGDFASVSALRIELDEALHQFARRAESIVAKYRWGIALPIAACEHVFREEVDTYLASSLTSDFDSLVRRHAADRGKILATIAPIVTRINDGILLRHSLENAVSRLHEEMEALRTEYAPYQIRRRLLRDFVEAGMLGLPVSGAARRDPELEEEVLGNPLRQWRLRENQIVWNGSGEELALIMVEMSEALGKGHLSNPKLAAALSPLFRMKNPVSNATLATYVKRRRGNYAEHAGSEQKKGTLQETANAMLLALGEAGLLPGDPDAK